MTIKPVLLEKYALNAEQCEIVAHEDGPLLVIAGPGSGKTKSLLLLALNLLLNEKAEPSELILCTYTERAASTMQDRLAEYSEAVGYRKDLSQLRIGTIHSICKQLIVENIYYTSLQNDFKTIDATEQQILILEHLQDICTPEMQRFYSARWGTAWSVACKLAECFTRIAEELLYDNLKEIYKAGSGSTTGRLQTTDERLRSYLFYSYRKYQALLVKRNCLDFAHLQNCVYSLLQHPIAGPRIIAHTHYVLVDEYQDTNYIQEQILRKLASGTVTQNLCVVGDEDQALYRFRGATVRNILEFKQTFPACKVVHLLINYRSHHAIISAYNAWMQTCDWTNSAGSPFRTEKDVLPIPKKIYPQYDSAYVAVYRDIYEEAEQFVATIKRLQRQGKIQDYSQVALLLRSVKPEFSAPYIQALEAAGIPYFCPRSGAYFEQEDVQLLIGCLARILDLNHTEHTSVAAVAQELEYVDSDELPAYLHACEERVRYACQRFPYLLRMLQQIQREIAQIEQNQRQRGFPLTTYFYRLLTVRPFLDAIKPVDAEQPEQQRHNLEQFSQLLALFQRYYPHQGLTVESLNEIRRDFFRKFLCVLYAAGLNLSEDHQLKLPPGHVPILTIHQAKGLEFPVVVVGRLDKAELYPYRNAYKFLQLCSRQQPFEPEPRIAAFDYYRLFYVAFSRARHLLLLTASKGWPTSLATFLQDIPLWEQANIERMPATEAVAVEPDDPLLRYGLTSHVQYYDTCPRQFQFFRHHTFVPGTQKEYREGQLVHYTLEHIHRVACDNDLSSLSESALRTVFERKFQAQVQSAQSAYAPLDEQQKERAWQQVLRYYEQNQEELRNIIATELPVQLRSARSVLTGKVDLLINTPHGPVMIDFKTQPRVDDDAPILKHYRQQLHFYAHSLERSNYQRPTKLFLYWTAEAHKQDALMEIPYDANSRAELDQDMQEALDNIHGEKFHVRRPPAMEVCRSCDIRYLCRQDNII